MKNLITATLMTLVTTAIFGLVYPLVITGIAQLIFPNKANGQLLIRQDRSLAGSRIIGQPFTGPGYFHSRPSSAGTVGYDARASSGSNLGPTSQKLMDRVKADVEEQAENPERLIPVDLVTASASGLDPHISPASAEFQVPRVARQRGLAEDEVRQLVLAHTQGRDFGFLGEPRVNVLELNLELDRLRPSPDRDRSLGDGGAGMD